MVFNVLKKTFILVLIYSILFDTIICLALKAKSSFSLIFEENSDSVSKEKVRK